jgi:hypothetical protein
MAVRILPTVAGLFHFRYRIDLDQNGTEFVLEYHFNPRDHGGRWRISLLNAAEQPLVMGRKLTLQRDLWRRFRYRSGMPKGRLEVVDVEGTGVQAGQDDLGRRVLVRYDDGKG